MKDHARLEALADLLDAGRSEGEAVAALVRLGGGVARWARPIEAATRGNAPLGMVLAQQRVLSDPELVLVGGAEHAGRPASLRVVAAQRKARHERARALWGALLVPGLVVVLSAGSTRFVLSLMGATQGGFVGDVLPLSVLAVVLAVGLMDRERRLGRFAQAPLVGGWIRTHQAARAAEALGAALTRADETPTAWASAFATAGRLAGAPALTRAAGQIGAGTPAHEALPTVAEVGEPLALCLTSGVAARDLPLRLFVFATSADAALTARLRTVVRVAAWGVVVWVNLRALWAMSSIDFMGGGLPGGAGLLPGLNDSDVRDLVRELDL
ncbi:MAG: hypothetical protein H6706_11000 [Myxococcales bacterium]|nr:hypothetical protein [Myxococcales bacterium]